MIIVNIVATMDYLGELKRIVGNLGALHRIVVIYLGVWVTMGNYKEWYFFLV